MSKEEKTYALIGVAAISLGIYYIFTNPSPSYPDNDYELVIKLSKDVEEWQNSFHGIPNKIDTKIKKLAKIRNSLCHDKETTTIDRNKFIRLYEEIFEELKIHYEKTNPQKGYCVVM